MKRRDEYELRARQWGARGRLIEIACFIRDELSTVRTTAYRRSLIKQFDEQFVELDNTIDEIDRLNKLFAKPRKK